MKNTSILVIFLLLIVVPGGPWIGYHHGKHVADRWWGMHPLPTVRAIEVVSPRMSCVDSQCRLMHIDINGKTSCADHDKGADPSGTYWYKIRPNPIERKPAL